MKTSFFHDCVFVIDEKKIYYTKGGLDYKKLNEYTKYFGNLTVFTRGRNIKIDDDKNKMTIASTSNVTFKSISKFNFISLWFGNVRKEIRKTVQDSDFIIIRMPSFIGHIAIKECKKMKKII